MEAKKARFEKSMTNGKSPVRGSGEKLDRKKRGGKGGSVSTQFTAGRRRRENPRHIKRAEPRCGADKAKPNIS